MSPTSSVNDVASEDVDRAMRSAFIDLDRDIMEEAAKAVAEASFLNDAMSAVGPAYSGSCALLACYHGDSRELKVACTGDSRAVLGRRNGDGQWKATALSVDQTGSNEDEVARLHRDHPDEPEMVKNGRILGLAVSRAFGDSRWKWSREVQEQAQRRFYGPNIYGPLLTPPYLTAEPVITTTIIEPDNGDFVIMASDGLWDNLTIEQAVDLVGRWLKTHDPAKEVHPPDLARAPTDSGKRGNSQRQNPNPNMAYTDISLTDEKDFIVVDDNAATHLARNALGGGNEDILCGKLTPGPPYSRNVR